MSPFDLHVLSTPPAFILSQDQTLRQITPFGVSFGSGVLLENDRASSSYHSSVVKVLIPRARFYSLYRLSSRPVDKNTDGPFYRTSSACLNDLLGVNPQACCVFTLLRICLLRRNLRRTWDRHCNRKYFPCQEGIQRVTARIWYWVVNDLPFRARPCAVNCATRGDYTPLGGRVKG